MLRVGTGDTPLRLLGRLFSTGAAQSPFRVGQSLSREYTVRMSDIEKFADVSTDANPVHLDPTYVLPHPKLRQKWPKGRVVAHGMLFGGYISALAGTGLPGPGSIYLRQEFRFLQPIFVDDSVRVTIEIVEVKPKTRRVVMKTTVRNVDTDALCIDGEAECMYPDPSEV